MSPQPICARGSPGPGWCSDCSPRCSCSWPSPLPTGWGSRSSPRWLRYAGPPEIVAGARPFNDLAERLRGLLQAEREAAADISHGLRTPVAALRLQVEGLSDPTIRETLLEDVTAIEFAIGAVIREARSRGDEGPGHCSLAAVARDRAAFWSVLAGDQGRSFGG